jgi:pyrimidine and pyridine-specific 5'-nucleotidase
MPSLILHSPARDGHGTSLEQGAVATACGAAPHGRCCLRLRPSLPAPSSLPVCFFDLDNTLYSSRTGIAELMATRIQLYFEQVLGLPEDESAALGRRYYRDYGLAIRGLVSHFSIDPAEYDAFVDGGLPLDDLLQPDPKLRATLTALHVRRWVFTNAGRRHALRVLQLLAIADLFEGVIYCDYTEPGFPCKPGRESYERAMACAGVADPGLCYFVDDAASNVRAAAELGWHAVHLDEQSSEAERRTETAAHVTQAGPSLFPSIRTFVEIKHVWTQLLAPQ